MLGFSFEDCLRGAKLCLERGLKLFRQVLGAPASSRERGLGFFC